MLDVEETALDGALILTPRRFGDARGYFTETFNAARAAEAGVKIDWVQDNESLSAPTGTLRGLHYQSPPHAQDKLVRVARGAIRDVAVDVRRGSPTYGQSVAVDLTGENGKQLLVPKGFLHGFVTLTPVTLVCYKCSDYYAPECDGSVRFDSAGVEWGVDLATVTLSDKDRDAVPFADFDSPFTYEAAQ